MTTTRTELVRSLGGNRIHKATCRHATYNNAIPWAWAEGREVAQVRMTATRLGVKSCRTCNPLDGPALRVIGTQS